MATVVSPWSGSGTYEDMRRAKVRDDYLLLTTRMTHDDYDGDTSKCVVEITCSEDVLTAIASNPLYTIL